MYIVFLCLVFFELLNILTIVDIPKYEYVFSNRNRCSCIDFVGHALYAGTEGSPPRLHFVIVVVMMLIVLKCCTFLIVSVLRHVSVNCCINVSSVFVSLCQLICRRISFLVLMLNVKCIYCVCMCT